MGILEEEGLCRHNLVVFVLQSSECNHACGVMEESDLKGSSTIYVFLPKSYVPNRE
jgi:hypothetical protein